MWYTRHSQIFNEKEWNCVVNLQRRKMFKFIKQIVISTVMLFGILSNVYPSECVSMKNQKCKVRPEVINVNSKEPIFYPYNI